MKYLKHIVIIASLILFSNVLAQESKKSITNSSKFFGWLVTNYQSEPTFDGANQFNVRMARLGFKGKFEEKIGYHFMAEFVSKMDKAPVFMQGWLEYYMPASLVLRVGQFKYELGQETLPSYMLWKFINPSYTSKGIVFQLGRSGNMFRDIGAKLSGHYNFSKTIKTFGSVMVMNGDGINVNDSNNKKDIVVHGGVKLPLNIETGVSYYKGTYSDTASINLDESAMNFYIKMKTKRFTVQAEYMAGDYKNVSGKSVKPDGYYAYATFKVLPEIELGVRYDSFESNTDIDNTDKNRVTFAAGYYFNKLNRIMVNYDMLGGEKNKGVDDLISVQFYFVI